MAFVYNNVINATAVQTNSFDNCYFNGSTKYVVQNNKDNSLVTVFNGCSVILGRDTVGYTCYIKNSFNSALQINDLNVRKSDKTKFIGLITQAQTAGILSRTSATIKMAQRGHKMLVILLIWILTPQYRAQLLYQ